MLSRMRGSVSVSFPSSGCFCRSDMVAWWFAMRSLRLVGFRSSDKEIVLARFMEFVLKKYCFDVSCC